MMSSAALAVVAGLAGGALSGFFGVGGNMVLVPLVAVLFGLTQQEAQGLTLAALLPPLGLPAVWQYARAKVPVLWPVVGVAILGFLPAVPLGSLVANAVPGGVLRLGFSVLLGASAWRVWKEQSAETERPVLSAPPPRFVWHSLAAGAGAGFASGLLGIGGAIVFIPLVRRGLGVGQRQAQATSLAMLLPPVALPGVLVYARAQGQLAWELVLPIAAGFLIGSFAGARSAHRVSLSRLTRGFAVLMAVSAVLMAASAVGPAL